jgi:3-oxoacyl-[acyl-carrier protein] reductase
MELDIKGRVAVITGPAKGMGAAITHAFAAEGCKLALLGRDVAAIEPVAAEVRARGAEAIVIACDITDGAACEQAISRTQTAFGGRIDILVNVAGGSGPIGKTGWETTEAEFDEIVDLNMRGCFNTMRACLPTMIAQRDGKIVNVGGTFGMRGRAGRMAYSASKWGLRGITKSFALEAGPFNINVNCVAPGMVDGPRFRGKVVPEMAARLGISEEAAFEKHAADYALRRVSTGEDVARACLFLASDVSRQITGVDLPVDGGWAML